MEQAKHPTYLLVDGENIDATLGLSVLNRRPNPEERPRWDQVSDFVADRWKQAPTSLFFLNASNGIVPATFVQALMGFNYRPIPLSGSSQEKVVDTGIQRTLEALQSRPGDVILASHDGDFVPQITALLGGNRRVGILCFKEFLSARLSELTERGLEVFDLEDDAHAFTSPLPRIRIIPLSRFNPIPFLN